MDLLTNWIELVYIEQIFGVQGTQLGAESGREMLWGLAL
jgi:hypothetical protein